MTAPGSHKKRISKRSSALSCFFLKTLQSASRNFDGLRFSSLLHKERSRMAKGMSPLRLLMRNPQRKTVPDSVEGGSSGVDATSIESQSRQPLVPIMITETVGNPPIRVAEQSSGEPSTPRSKSKISSQGQEKFPHLENSDRHAASVNATPDKTSNLQSKGKFTWQHRHGPVAHSTTREGPPDLSTPPRPPKGSASSDGQATALSANKQDTSQTLRGCSTGGGSVPSTPKGGRSVGNKDTNELENGGSLSQNSTPSKSVSRSLKYGQQGSASNTGASGIPHFRSAVSQHAITRPMGYVQALKGGVPQTINQNFVEHHFELEEDASFWCDHNVQVIIRTRPISNSELAAQGSNRCLKQESPHTVSWLGQPESRFTFDHVAGETVTQAKLFDVAGLPMVENCMSGYNSCMFAYGQTGSGKTHTMLGDIEHLDRSPSDNRGITPRVFEYLFGRMRKEQECRRQEHLKFFCKCSFLEIYNEQITDLLEPSSTNLQMREDAKKGVYVENLSEVEVQSVQDVIQLLLQGAANRKVAATNMNRESSRSHSVFTCVVESKWENNFMTNSRYGRLHLVDLAGSERQKSSGAEGGRLKEAANINKSLSTLGLVMMILVDVANGKQRHVPYRDSKLTFLLQDSLGGNSKTIMIANVSPSSCSAMETLSTLKFAQRAKFIRNNAVINEDASGDVIALRQRIEELKGEVDRLRRESVLRISSSRVLALENSSTAEQTSGDKLNAPTVNCPATDGFASDSIHANKSQITSIANNDKHLRSMEAVLAGALRREQQAEDITKKLAAQIEQLDRLVRQREEDSQCSKMMLRFREEKIRRLEGIADNVLSAESFFADERKNLIDELQLIRARLDRNPELTRFAMENIRLMEELRRYQEFYDGGERDVLLEEISGLRSQILDKLDIKLGEDLTMGKLSTPQKRALAPELSTLERENELLLIEVKNYQDELKECRNNLNSCLVANTDLARQVDELQATVKELQCERSEGHEEQDEVPRLDRQETASSANPTSALVPLEAEELASQHRQALTNVEEQVSDLKKQLQEAQDLIWKLSSEVAGSKMMTCEEADLEGKRITDGRKVDEYVACVAEEDAVVREGIQDRWEKLQEIEMRHAEEITHLQLELDTMEDVVKEERQQRLVAEQKNEDLSNQLSAAESQLEKGQALVEDGLEEERHQRMVAEQNCEALRSQLSAAVSQIEQGKALVEDDLKEEREQRLVAEQKCEELSSRLSTAVSQLEQAQALVEDRVNDERQQRLVAGQKCEELNGQLSAAVCELHQAQCLVEALEGQQLFSINEFENLQSEHTKLLSKMNRKEEEERELQKKFQDESNSDDPVVSILEHKLLRARRGKEEARRMNRQFQEEKASRMALEKEREATMSEVETQAALAITTLQAEILELREEVSLAVESEAAAKLQLARLQKEVETLQQTTDRLEDNNKLLSNTSDRYSSLVDEKDAQLRKLQAQWESATSKLIDYLADGDKALTEAANVLDEINHGKVQEVSQTDDHHTVQNRDGSVYHCLHDVQLLVRETEGQVRALGDAAATPGEITGSKFEDGEAMIRESEKKSMVAFLMVRELLERIKDLKSVQQRLVEENQQAHSKERAKDLESSSLQQQLEDLRRQFGELNDEHQLVVGKHEDLREENDRSSLELGNADRLKAKNVRLEEEIRESRRAFAEKDEENRNLHQQLDEIQTRSTVTADRYELLMAAHDELKQEQARYVEDQASKAEEGEQLIRLSERKAMAVLVMVEQLLRSRNELKASNMVLTKEIQDGRLLLAEKQAALANSQQQLEEDTHHHKEIADQYQLLAETHGDLQQALETLLAEKALRVEEDEALIRFSEREAMAAFVVVGELVEKMKELKARNSSLATEIQDAHLALAERDTVVASLQQELETLLAEKAVREEGDEAVVRISEQKAMAAFVVVGELGEKMKELKGTNSSLATQIQDAHLALAERDTVVASLQQELETLLAEKAVRVEGDEAVVRISEQKAMAAFVVVGELGEKMKELKGTNSSLATQIQDAHLALAERDTVVASLQQELETLLAEKAVREEGDEAVVRFSERKAMAAFVVVGELGEKMEELKGTNSSLATQIQDAHLALAERDTVLASLHQELETLLAEKAVRVEGDEGVVRFSERKAMAAFVVVGELGEKMKELKGTNSSLATQIQDAHLALAERDTVLASLHQELETLLAEKAVRVEGDEGVVRFSERKAMAAFVVVGELGEKMKELKGTNSSLATQIQDAHLALAERDTVLASLQNDLSEYSDGAKSHQILTEAYENLRQDQERLVEEHVLTVEDGERAIKLSERKAMVALVALSQIVDGKTDLKMKAERLERDIEGAYAALEKNTTELVAVQQNLDQRDDEAMKVAAQQQVLMAAHDALQEEHDKLQEEFNKVREGQDSLQEELAKAREERESLQAELEKAREEHESLEAKLEEAREEYASLQAALEKAEDKHEIFLRDYALGVEEREQMVKVSEKKAMGSLIMAEHLIETLQVLKVTESKLEKEIEESRSAQLAKDAMLAVVQRQLEESLRYRNEVCDGHQVLVEKYENLMQDYDTCLGENSHIQRGVEKLELDLKAYHAQVRVLQELSVAAEQQCSEVCTEALKTYSGDDMKIGETIEFMTSVSDALDRMWHELLLVEVAVDQFSSLERDLSTCLSKVLMLEEANGGNMSARESLENEISRLATTLQLKERERAALASEKELSRRDFLDQEEMVQSLLLELQTLNSTLKDRELRVSDMLTGVQVLVEEKAELELGKSRLVSAAGQAETKCREKELEISAIQGDLAVVQARLRAAELREQSVSFQMEQLASASVASEIESAVVEHEMRDLRAGNRKLGLQLNALNLEIGKRELAFLEIFRRSEGAFERVEARMTAMDQELVGVALSKGNLEHDMALLESAATGCVLALEEKELECFELKTQLGIADVQITQMRSAMDLATGQIAIEESNREADRRRMEEEKRACETELRDEIASAELLSLSTERALKIEVQRLESSLKQAEFRVSEMQTAVTALTVAKEELELERSRLVQASSQAEMNCRVKEEQLIASQGDLAGVLAKVAEAEVRDKSLSGQLEELAEAKLEWEVDRAVVKREIEQMRKEKDQLRFELNYLNAEVEERETAIFESFSRSQEALEKAEARLTIIDHQLAGLGAFEENLEHSITLLDSASTIAMVAFEENEHKFLEMQVRIQNAELQMSEMQSATDFAITQFTLDRENWEVEKSTVKLERDARETELRDEIAAAQLKLVAIEGSLRTAVQNVEALGFGKKALEEELRELHEDAKISLLKVAEQQQKIDSLREMSRAFKAECKEADESTAALNQLREQYLLAEVNWRNERELLTRKLEELDISAERQIMEGGGNEPLDNSADAREFSQFVPEGILQSEVQEPSEEFEELKRQQQDNQVLRTIISEKEMTIQSAKKELHIAVANCKETEVEMDKVHVENSRLIQTELESKSLIDSLSVKLRIAGEELLKRDRKIEGCEAEFLKVAGIMSDWETRMEDAESEWRRDKEALAQELTEAKLVANEKRTEAASILQKFQDGQATLKEAEYLMDALVKANENAKHDALDWKTDKESLGIVQGWWMPERDKLVSEIARLESDMHTQKQDAWITCKEAVIGLVETMDVLSVVEQEFYELKNDHQQEMEHFVGEIRVLKNDHQQEMEHLVEEIKVLKINLVSRLQFPSVLRVEQMPRSAISEAKLETMGRMPEVFENSHCNREEELKVRLLELEHSRSELASVQVTVCHLQAELKDQSKALRGCHEKLRSADEVNAEVIEKYYHGVMQWEEERDQLMEERLKQQSENGKLQSYLKAAEHSYAKCSSELLALTRAVSAEDLIFQQLETDLKSLIVDVEEVKDQTLVVMVGELRADHREMRNITCEMSTLRDEVVELGNLSTAIVHRGQKQSADLAEERQLNRFVQLYQQELEFTREILRGSLAFSETLVSQLQEISVQLEEVTPTKGIGTLKVKLRSDFGAMKGEILNFRKTAEEEFRVWTLHRNVTGQENERLFATVQDLQSKNAVLNIELDESRRSIDILEEELVLKEQRIGYSLQIVNSQLKAVEKERDRYQTDLVVLNEQLDMAQSLADERDLVAAEARQAAELSKSHAEEKEGEARILERSVEELERTVYALETQLGIVRRESERHRVEREALEKDLESLKHQMGLMQLTIDSQEAQTVRGLQDAEASKTELDRMAIEMKNQQTQARKSVESLQQECAEKDVQLRSCKAYIAELVLGAEKQASENQQKLKTLEAMVDHLKVEERKANPSGGSASKSCEKSTGKVKGPGSPFKCIGSGLEKQRSSEMDEELSATKKRIKELEAVAASRQKEVFMLNTKLAEAESMTHDVIRDLLGVKVDIASYASLLNQQQVQRIAERARRRTEETQQKEEELDTLRKRLNEFIEERESWLEEINRRQAEAVAARVSSEKLRLRDQTLTTENETFREDCLVLRKKVAELEDEMKKLSGQQNLQQRIHHHAKIKEENNSIRLQNEDLSGKLRRMEILFTRLNDELARYRTAEGKSAFINFDEEARLQKKLQETEENRLQLAETLIGLCTGIMQAAGIQRTSRDLDPSAAITVLQQLQDRQECLERELSDYKLKARIAAEKRRLSDLRDFHTPVKTIGANTNFTASQQLPSPVSSSR